MKNKGFTLIELLAVITILMIIITILAPKVFKQLKTAENVTDKEQINALINTSKIYMNQNANLLPPENDLYIISLNELKESGLIQKNQILNPSTNEELTGCIVVSYEKNKYKYEYKEDICNNNIITVAFDPQGGQLNQTTKKVLYNNTYGELPTPTKEGYTFMGWNGKNMYSKDNTTVNQYVSFEKNLIIFDSSSVEGNKINGGIFVRTYLNNTNKGPIYKDNYEDNYSHLIEPKELFDQIDIKTNTNKADAYLKIKNILESDKQYMLSYSIDLLDNKHAKAILSNVQLEEGNTATEYEPYYITSDTTVVQETNHTLKAIWQANS